MENLIYINTFFWTHFKIGNISFKLTPDLRSSMRNLLCCSLQKSLVSKKSFITWTNLQCVDFLYQFYFQWQWRGNFQDLLVMIESKIHFSISPSFQMFWRHSHQIRVYNHLLLDKKQLPNFEIYFQKKINFKKTNFVLPFLSCNIPNLSKIKNWIKI